MHAHQIVTHVHEARAQGPFHKTRPLVKLPFLTGDPLAISHEPDIASPKEVAEIVARLCEVDPAMRAPIADAMLAACRESFEICAVHSGGPQDHLEEEAGYMCDIFADPREPRTAEDVWPLVSFFEIAVGRPRPDMGLRAKVRGYAAWAAGDGVALIFDAQGRLDRVGTLND